MQARTIAFFPEAAYGPAMNSVGIAQTMKQRGHRVVFLSDPGFVDVYRERGFEAHPVNLSAPMPPEQMARFWADFVNTNLVNFNKSPYEQIDNYVKDCWSAIVDSARYAQADLPGVLARLAPDIICVDNVILFPAIKQHGVPWVRIVSCSENEIEDPALPPHLSGCTVADRAGHERYRRRFEEVIGPVHARFNAFLQECGEAPYPIGQFFETSPFLNLLLYPEAVRFKRQNPLPADRFHFLEGCVRQERPYEMPAFDAADARNPLIYLSFGSLGAGDVPLLKRLIAALGRFACRALVNVGDGIAQFDDVPRNVRIASWFPQPSVIPLVDAVIHHGGNNTFTECLYFGKPAVVMPFVWDGHDNATRIEETGFGFKLARDSWTDDDLFDRLRRCLSDATMRDRLADCSARMRAQDGPTQAALRLEALLAQTGARA